MGKKKYAEFDGLARETLEKARDLEHRFLDVMQRDTEAFNAVSAVFAMPKGTDEEKTARSQAMQQALQGCTRTPFEMMELSLEALRLTEGLVDRSNANAASDLGCAALHLGCAIQGAWLNVLINLGSIRDVAFAAQYRQMFADNKWGAKETYHLCVNTSGHEIKDLIPGLAAFVRCWFGEK